MNILEEFLQKMSAMREGRERSSSNSVATKLLRAWFCILIFLLSFVLLVTVSFRLDISIFYNSNQSGRGLFVIKLIRLDPKLSLCNFHLICFYCL